MIHPQVVQLRGPTGLRAGLRPAARRRRRRSGCVWSNVLNPMNRTAAALVAVALSLSACVFLLYNASSDSIRTTGLLIGHGFLGAFAFG